MIEITPSIRTLSSRLLVGMSMEMSVADNRTSELWRHFMENRHKIEARSNEDYISLQVYGEDYFHAFNPQSIFTKWAAVEVSEYTVPVEDMEKFTLEGGLYAVFDYKGMPGNPEIFQYIFTEWLPGSGYRLDNRPHFEVIGNKYKANSPESEEEIWIPIKNSDQ